MPVCKSPQLVFVAAALSFALVSASSAAEPDTSSWLCERCIGASGWELDIEAGPAWVADDVYRFGDYSGLDEKGTYLFGDFIGSYRDDDANYFAFEGYTRSKDATALFVKGGKQSLYELRASYQAIPRRIFATTATPYGGTGTSNLTLPTSWVRAPTTGQMTALADTLQPINIGWDWNIYGLGFDIKPGERWQFTTDYTRREREGVSRSAGAFYFDAVEFAAPVKYTTDDLEMALSYNSDNWQTSMRYFGSVFKNDNSSLTFANPYLAISGADTGQLALPPGNESHQLSLAGSLLLPARTTLTGQLSLGHLTQNADLLPYTTNPSLAGGTLPVASAGTEADTVNINIRAVTTPVSDWTFEGELRYNDFNNKTDINEYNYIVTDVIPAANAVNNTAYDYTRRDIKLRAEYRAFRSTKFLGGFDTERMERNRQDRSRTTTNRLWFRMRTRLAANADLDVDLFAEDRNGSVYEPVAKPGAAENPLMRKYNMADRQRNGIKLRGSVYPGERSDLGWEFEYGRDDYRTSEIGLEESSYVRFGGDFAYLLTDSATAYASLYN